jgi:hypothetical protein
VLNIAAAKKPGTNSTQTLKKQVFSCFKTKNKQMDEDDDTPPVLINKYRFLYERGKAKPDAHLQVVKCKREHPD